MIKLTLLLIRNQWLLIIIANQLPGNETEKNSKAE